jgi:hypothetical protein
MMPKSRKQTKPTTKVRLLPKTRKSATQHLRDLHQHVNKASDSVRKATESIGKAVEIAGIVAGLFA